MSTEMKLEGVLKFAEEADLQDAIADAAEILEEMDPDLASLIHEQQCFEIQTSEVRVFVEITGPPEWFYEVEEMLETFIDFADEGEVKAWFDGEELDTYRVGDEPY